MLAAAFVAALPVMSPIPAVAGTPTCLGQPATIVGTDSDDVLVGTPGADVIVGLAGSDTIDGAGGNDVLCADSDEPAQSSQVDRVSGGSGNDRLKGTYSSTLDGQAGDDDFVGAPGSFGLRLTFADSPVGVRVDLDLGVADGWGHDTISGIIDVLVGSHHDDVLLGHDISHVDACGQGGCESLLGLAGDDVLRGRNGVDSLGGGPGDDRLFGGGERDHFIPGPGDDRMSDSGDTHDWLWFTHARRGVRVNLRAGTATGQGHDRFTGIEDVNGSNHADVIKGSHTVNHMNGYGGDDRVYGRGRHDGIAGGGGDDVLVGGPGPRDFIDGGSGKDTCDAEEVHACERS